MIAGLVLSCALSLLTGGAGEADSLVRAGDDAFARIEYPGAIARYAEALASRPGDPSVLWRLARASVCSAEVTEGEEHGRLLADAERYARACIAADSLKAEGHTWLAGALGYLALEEKTEKKLVLSRELQHEAERAVALNPADDAAYSILGSFYRALGNVGWVERTLASLFVGSIPKGGYAEADSALTTAIRLAPGIMRHRYEIGILYLDMGRKEEARRALETAASLPVKTAIDRPRLAKIREILSGPDFR